MFTLNRLVLSAGRHARPAPCSYGPPASAAAASPASRPSPGQAGGSWGDTYAARTAAAAAA